MDGASQCRVTARRNGDKPPSESLGRVAPTESVAADFDLAGAGKEEYSSHPLSSYIDVAVLER